MPEDEHGQVPEGDVDVDHDNPDEWRDICDDPTDDPYTDADGE